MKEIYYEKLETVSKQRFGIAYDELLNEQKFDLRIEFPIYVTEVFGEDWYE